MMFSSLGDGRLLLRHGKLRLDLGDFGVCAGSSLAAFAPFGDCEVLDADFTDVCNDWVF